MSPVEHAVELGLCLDGEGLNLARVAGVGCFEKANVESHDLVSFSFVRPAPCKPLNDNAAIRSQWARLQVQQTVMPRPHLKMRPCAASVWLCLRARRILISKESINKRQQWVSGWREKKETGRGQRH